VDRKQLSKDYKRLFTEVSAILFQHDPIGINFEDNTDEYDPEAGTILPRLRPDISIDDLTAIVYEEFVHWFGWENVGGREIYAAIASEILAVYRKTETC
jgi:hypothetical protein